MKNLVLFFLIALLCSCNESPKSATVAAPPSTKNIIDYPEALDKVFANHGTLEKWNSMNSMSYEIVKEGGNEKQIIDLKSRAERIEASSFTSGFDGTKYWVQADTSYKGNPKFYTNLMFYFYAMPFVLADEGINYTKAEPLIFEDKEYPGFRISYGDGVGVSPEDEYFIHYDAQSFEMAWLGYTVTFYSGEKSDKIKWIRYDDWMQFNGLKLPNSLSWYKTEEGKITELRNTRNFENVMVSEKQLPESILTMPAGAKVFE